MPLFISEQLLMKLSDFVIKSLFSVITPKVANHCSFAETEHNIILTRLLGVIPNCIFIFWEVKRIESCKVFISISHTPLIRAHHLFYGAIFTSDIAIIFIINLENTDFALVNESRRDVINNFGVVFGVAHSRYRGLLLG
jgi:hypothetical protein